jgi:hypothetical protein
MKNLLAFIQVIAFTCAFCSATSTVPFKPRAITVDYGKGRSATFTFEPSRIEKEINKSKEEKRGAASSSDTTAKPEERGARDWMQPGTKIVKVEFTFSDGQKAIVDEADLKGIDIIDLSDSEIETLVEEGSWVLSLKIRNLQHIVARVADDRVVFIFEKFKYTKRRLELDYKWNANK